jgi:hypothetical protein
MKTVLATVAIALCMAGLGHYVAALNIWWYHLGEGQAALANWGYPIVFGLAAGFYGYHLVTEYSGENR